MSSALTRGKTLNPEAVKIAKQWREQRVKSLLSKRTNNTASLKELRELKWKWGVDNGQTTD